MPRPQVENSVYQEGRISLAIQAIQSDQISNVQTVANTYDVPRTTLRDRLHGRVVWRECRPNSYKLAALDEFVLKSKYYLWSNVEYYLEQLLYEKCPIYSLLAMFSLSPHEVGINWVYKFVRRHCRMDSVKEMHMLNRSEWTVCPSERDLWNEDTYR
jgi:hypothetical protein